MDLSAKTLAKVRVKLHCGDCLDVLKTLPDCSIDSCVTDPPYHLTSIVKRFGAKNAAPPKFGKDGAYARASAGFMGKAWDGGDVAFRAETWREVFRVLKPGGHMLVFGGTRTFHRLVCAIEDAGFEIRDTVGWLYGQGFPKSHDVSKGIDREAGAKRKVVGRQKNYGVTKLEDGKVGYGDYAGKWDITLSATNAGRKWEGWGTALKPAMELICLARKPLSEKTVAQNVLRWGTGALNISGCKVNTKPRNPGFANRLVRTNTIYGKDGRTRPLKDEYDTSSVRWPANLCHDGSDEVVSAFPESAGQQGSRADSGSAARFFYHAKANKRDRNGSKHPTVKPTDLIRYLVRMITPPKGVVLDPFAGTGTTGEAAYLEGMQSILIEREKEYQIDIRRRMKSVLKKGL